MIIGKFKSKFIRVSNRYFKIKPTALARMLNVSLATVYRHIGK